MHHDLHVFEETLAGQTMSDDELLELEHRGWEALSGRAGVAFYDKLLTDDALMVFPMGVFDRSDSLAAIRAAEPWQAFRLADVRISHPVPDVGIVTYRATATRGGSDYEAWMTSAYVRDSEGNWRLALHQQSPG
jgi:hypothetical protein